MLAFNWVRIEREEDYDGDIDDCDDDADDVSNDDDKYDNKNDNDDGFGFREDRILSLYTNGKWQRLMADRNDG